MKKIKNLKGYLYSRNWWLIGQIAFLLMIGFLKYIGV